MNPIALIFAALALTGVMAILVPLATGVWPGGIEGYFAILALYWVAYCAPIAWASGAASRLSLRVGSAIWVPILVLGQAAMFALYGALNGYLSLPAEAYALGALAALINAPLEELAWRGAYLSASRGNLMIQALGVWLFALWHVPLMFASGVIFGAEPFAIVVSAFCLGALWALVAWRTGSVAWPIIGHTLTNLIAFPALIAANS